MKKDTFTVLMIVAVFMALPSVGLLFSDVGAIIYPISLALFSAVQAPLFLWLKMSSDEAKKRKIRLWMVLLMLIPTLVAIAAIAYVVIGLMIYFA